MGAASVPAGSLCANHSTAAATWICRRCGSFVCHTCERRVRRDSRPLCPTCWEVRQNQVNAIAQRGGLEQAGAALAMGVVSLFPLPPVQMASLYLGVRALSAVPPEARWKVWVGLGLTGAGILLVIAGVVAVILNSGGG